MEALEFRNRMCRRGIQQVPMLPFALLFGDGSVLTAPSRMKMMAAPKVVGSGCQARKHRGWQSGFRVKPSSPSWRTSQAACMSLGG